MMTTMLLACEGKKQPIKIMTVEDLASEYAREQYGANKIQHIETFKGNCSTCYAVDLYIDESIYMRVYIKDNVATNEDIFEEITEIKPITLEII